YDCVSESQTRVVQSRCAVVSVLQVQRDEQCIDRREAFAIYSLERTAANLAAFRRPLGGALRQNVHAELGCVRAVLGVYQQGGRHPECDGKDVIARKGIAPTQK